MIVKPAPGLKVRHPDTKQFLPPEGIPVPDGDIFWTRVANDSDVEIVDEGESAAQAPAVASNEEPVALAAPANEEADKQ